MKVEEILREFFPTDASMRRVTLQKEVFINSDLVTSLENEAPLHVGVIQIGKKIKKKTWNYFSCIHIARDISPPLPIPIAIGTIGMREG